MEALRAYFNHFIDLSDREWGQLSALLTRERFRKGEHIYGSNDRADAIYFITDGIVRSYKLEPDGKDFTWTFHCLNMDALKHRMLMDVAVVDYVSFTHNVPEELAFEVVADATLYKIDKTDLYALYEQDIRWQRFATKMAEDVYAITRERTFHLLTKNAKERLELLMRYFPGVFDKGVSVEHIASYLGITRQSLNRLLRAM
jgi:CRP-like cAMP-binding protein